MEYQDELGLNLYDMDMRDYDPAIGRWTGIDPVTHFDQSPYMGMNGNPVTFADPSGANGIGGENFTSVFGMQVSTPTNTGMYTGMSDNGRPIPFATNVGAAWGDGGLLATTITDRSQINNIIGYYARESGYRGFSFTYTDKDSGMDDKGAVGFYQYKKGNLDAKNIFKIFLDADIALAGRAVQGKGSTFRVFNNSGSSFSPKIYSSGWKGGSVGNIKTYGIASTALHFAGQALGWYGVGSSAYDIGTGQVSVAEGSTNIGFGLIGIFGGINGALISGSYELGKIAGPSKWYGNNNFKWFE